MGTPTKRELELAIEALVALVEEEYPSLPLSDLARGLSTYQDSGLVQAHYDALAKVECVLFADSELDIGGSRPDELKHDAA